MTTKFSDRFIADKAATIDYTKLRASAATAYSSELPSHMAQLVEYIRGIPALNKPKLKILDMTAHVGGFSLPWAKAFPRDSITAVERDAQNYQNLVYNVHALRLQNVHPEMADSSVFIRSLKPGSYSFVYVDPPWGGPEYRRHKGLQLYLGDQSLPNVIQTLFDAKVTDWVFAKVPTNYDFQSLPFRYTVRTVAGSKRSPDYLLVTANRAGVLAGKKTIKGKN